MYINVNGQFFNNLEAKVSYNNRAFKYGYGVFETMLVVNGKIQLKQYHWERLFSSLELLNITLPEAMTQRWLEIEVLRTVKENQLQKNLCRCRLQIYASNGTIGEQRINWSEFVIECYSISESMRQLNDEGIHLSYAQGLSKSNDSLSNIKSTNALLYVIASQQALANNTDDTIIINTNGNPIETTIANIFCIKDDIIYTPPLSEGCINGVMRRHVIAVLSKHNIPVNEQAFTKELLIDADAVFITNAIRKIKWVEAIDDHKYSKDKVTKLYELFQ